MGKLSQLASEPMGVAERLKINIHRVRLAGIGLFSIMDTESTRLYKQVLERGESYGSDDSLLGRLSLVSTGTLNFVKEGTQRVFDELVEEGEMVTLGSKPRLSLSTTTAKITTPRPVAKSKSSVPLPSMSKSFSQSQQGLTDLQLARLEKAKKTVAQSRCDMAFAIKLQALVLQISEGDVKGRRPTKTQVEECLLFDARKAVKGLNKVEALEQYLEIANSLPMPVPEAP